MTDYQQLFARIKDDPRVKEMRPEWYTQMCDKCWWQHNHNNVGILAPWGDFCKQAISHVSRTTYYTGPDLLAPSNLHDALGLGDELFDAPPSIEWTDIDDASNMGFIVYGWVGNKYTWAPGPTRSDAVVSAIARALGVEG